MNKKRKEKGTTNTGSNIQEYRLIPKPYKRSVVPLLNTHL